MSASEAGKAAPAMTPPPGMAPDSAMEPNSATNTQGRIHWRRLLQRRLLIRVTVPTLIGVVQLAFAIIAIVNDRVPARILAWALPALLVGYLFGRSTKIAWDDEKAQIVLIRAQFLITVGYVVLRVAGHFALERTFSDRVGLADVLLVLSFGLFVGRTVGLAGQIRRALSSRDHRDPGGPRNDADVGIESTQQKLQGD